MKERKKERKKEVDRDETENRTYGKQRLAEAGLAWSYSPDQSASSQLKKNKKTGLNSGSVLA